MQNVKNRIFFYQGAEILNEGVIMMLFRGGDGRDYFVFYSDMPKILSECNGEFDEHARTLRLCPYGFNKANNCYIHFAESEVQTGIPE